MPKLDLQMLHQHRKHPLKFPWKKIDFGGRSMGQVRMMYAHLFAVDVLWKIYHLSKSTGECSCGGRLRGKLIFGGFIPGGFVIIIKGFEEHVSF